MELIKDKFANLLETPDRIKFRDFLKSNFGELDYFDFKLKWCEYPKLAKHILAIANIGGGMIIVGVNESAAGEITPVGIDQLKDKADIENGIGKYLPSNLKFEILDFHYKESEYNSIKGKMFQVVLIKNTTKHLPFISSKASGSDIKENVIYTRRGTQSVEINHNELQELINKRIETEYSTSSEMKLEEHLAQLKILYSQIKEYHYNDPMFLHISDEELDSLLAEQDSLRSKNKNYPQENYEEFLNRMIITKKAVIETAIKK